MKHLTILLPEGKCNVSSITGSYEVFLRANDYWRSIGKKEVFRVQLAGISAEITPGEGLFTVRADINVAKIKKTDLVIIPAVDYQFPDTLKRNGELISWIREQYEKGAEIASLCTGAFLLASTGLLEGKSCSTHWIAAEPFRQMFPKVNLVTGKVITDEYGIYTNGGAFSFLNLLLYLVEKYYDRETAIFCSKVFQIDIDRNSQSPYTMFSRLKNHEDELVEKAQLFIEQHFQDRFSMEQLAGRLTSGRRNFDRRFKKATSHTPAEYLQRVRVEAAKRCLETGRKTISEAMYEVGYSDTKTFREIFRKITGLSPLDYRNKYNKGTVATMS